MRKDTLYFKVLKKFIPQVMIYGVFFVILTLVNIQGSWNAPLMSTRCRVYWVAEEKNSLVDHLKEILLSSPKIEILLEDEPVGDQLKDQLKDALMLNKVDCVIKVPKGFAKQIASSQPLSVEIMARKEDRNIQEVEQIIEAYIKGLEGEQKSSWSQSNQGMSQKSDRVTNTRTNERLRIYFNQMIYGLSAIILVGVLSVTYSINEEKVRIRRCCAPNQDKENRSLLKGHLIYSSVSLLILLLLGGVIDLRAMLSMRGLMWSMNSVLLMLNIVAIAKLFSLFVKNTYIQMMVTNVFTLGVNFISGTTIEQQYLSESTIRLAQFLPTYWYVKVNNLIANVDHIGHIHNRQILGAMGIEVLFILALGVIILVVQEEVQEGEAV